MSVIQIREAQREGARLVIGIAGISGSGKTFTALELAHGLANGDPKKVGFLDTENKRGSLYADRFPGFLIGDLFAPFSPQRYIDAIRQFQDAGVEVLVIDSASHEWEGLGGCEEIAAKGGAVNGWKVAKAQHKLFMNTLLQCNMHVIMCFRAREKVDFTDTRNPVKLGIQPITEKNVLFEMTASMMMWDQGRSQSVIKCPEDLRGILGREDGYITREDGLALRKWVDGVKQLDPEVEAARNSLQTVTSQGSDALRKAWEETPKAIRTKLGAAVLDQLKRAAADFDKVKGRSETPDSVAALNAEEEPVGDPPGGEEDPF